jgi:hypothetical protein
VSDESGPLQSHAASLTPAWPCKQVIAPGHGQRAASGKGAAGRLQGAHSVVRVPRSCRRMLYPQRGGVVQCSSCAAPAQSAACRQRGESACVSVCVCRIMAASGASRDYCGKKGGPLGVAAFALAGAAATAWQ